MAENSLVKILLVDDLAENLYALEVILSNENYLCVKASSGREALKILHREQGFAIILMDVQMPMMDGFETVELIRQIEKFKHIPIIFLTASMDNSVHIFKGYQSGAVDYMIKPLSPEILKAKVAVFVDLYKKTHELLVQKEQIGHLAAIVEFSDDAIISESLDGTIKSWNKGAEKMFGYTAKQAVGNHISLIIPPEYFNEEKKILERIRNNEIIEQWETVRNKKSGEQFYVSLTVSPLKDRAGGSIGVSKIARDITFRKKSEVEIIQKTEDLVHAIKELAFQNEEKEKRAAELSIANKELLAFTYLSSHDLQEPLRKIQTFVTIILEKENQNLSDNGKYNFRRMQLAAGRMQQLIEDLLAFSRINTAERKFVKTDLNIIIEEVKTELKDTIQEKHATIEATELCPANIIAFQFRQLMYNLISNALKFSHPDIPAHIIIKSRIVKGSKLNNPCLPDRQEKLSPEKNYCHITVKDNGIGFEPHFSERIFEVFQKLHSKEVYAGTGIGLAIVKKIVENHNGIIIATGELKKGATFDIYIPAN